MNTGELVNCIFEVFYFIFSAVGQEYALKWKSVIGESCLKIQPTKLIGLFDYEYLIDLSNFVTKRRGKSSLKMMSKSKI